MPLAPGAMDVYLTVDTEVWPRNQSWSDSDLELAVNQDIFGITDAGEFGITYQLDVLDSFGLRAVFFVESLFASAAGLSALSRIVAPIVARGHDVQLHLHPEWLQMGASAVLPGRTGQHLKHFSLDDQEKLIAAGLENLTKSGATCVRAFRAGNCGANFDTLRALSRCGIAVDSSYNVYYLNSHCGLRTEQLLLQPTELEGVVEFPIGFFQDWPGHYRHAQLGACSGAELQAALLGAHRQGWPCFVILTHSFELLKGRHANNGRVEPDRRVIERFWNLCRFLAANRDAFRSAVFFEYDRDKASSVMLRSPKPLRSNVARTSWRYVEQLSRRFR